MQDNASDTPPPAQDLADSGISEAVEGEILWISEAAPDGSAFDVMIIEAGTSKNGRRYSDDVLRRSAPLFEGQGVYAYEVKPGILDHLGEADKATVGDGGGGVRNLVGALEGVKFGEANGRRGLVARMSVVAPWARQLFKGVWESGKRHLLGFSIDARAKVQQTIEGVTDVIEIAPGPTLDVVSHPAAGGALLRIAASFSEEAMEPQDQIEIPEPAAEPATEPTPAPVKEAAPVFDAAAAADAVQLVVDCRESVRSTVAASGLPDASQRRIAESVNGPFATVADAKVAADAAIASEREYLQTLGVPEVTGSGTVRESATAGAEELDRLQVAMDGLFARQALQHDGVTIQPFTSLHEAIHAITGKMPGIDVSFDDALGMAAGYKPWRKPMGWSATRESATPAPGDAFRRVSEAITTTTFGQILGDSITRKMQADYALDDRQSWRKIVTVENVRDFRTQRRQMLGGYGTLTVVGESANYPLATSPGDDEETYSVQKRGLRERLTVETLASDDVGLVRRIPERLGRAASETLFRAVFDVLTANAAMYDGNALFSGPHANTNTVALAGESLRLAVAAMKDQAAYGDASTLLGGSNKPKFILVPHELAHLAFVLTQPGILGIYDVAAGNAPGDAQATSANHPDFAGIEVIEVPHWTDANDWYLCADPMRIPTIEVGFLNGREEPELFVADSPTSGAMFDSDNIEYKIRHVYGVKALDWRGFYRNAVA